MPRTNNPSTSAFRAAATATTLTLATIGLLHWLDIPSMLQKRQQSRRITKRNFDPTTDKPSIAELRLLCAQQTLGSTYPLATAIESNVPIYHASDFDLESPEGTEKVEQLKDELYHNLLHGPGVYVIRGFFADLEVVNSANKVYAAIAANKARKGGGGDHFAPAAANTRIWNCFQKHGERDPAGFLAYYSNPWFEVVSDGYLGPGYRITTQMNTVRPGGKAQMPHRDYHLGFMGDENVIKFPRAVHEFSGKLTLQGAVAHTDMPCDSGPTRLLPYSQTFAEGFWSYRREEFVEFFLENYVALPLQKGDGLFFSPALFHAAGENVTQDFDRTANLVQVSSAFGKPMETVDSLSLIERSYDALLEMARQDGNGVRTEAFIRAVAEGYPFPTNLDRRAPQPGAMAPESEQDVLRRCIREGKSKKDAMAALTSIREGNLTGEETSPQLIVFGT